MSTVRRLVAVGALSAAALLAAAGSAAAGIWTQVPTGIPDEISAIDYHADGRLWFATTNGKLAFREANGELGFGAGVPAATVFTDIAFRPAGDVGIAVGLASNVWRTADGGRTWRRLTLPVTLNNDDCGGAPGPGTSTFNDAFSVTFATPTVAYVTGDRGNILRSTNAGATFDEINKKTAAEGGGCRVDARTTTDAAFVGPDRGYFIAGSHGRLWFTENGLLSDAVRRSDLLPGLNQRPRMTLDPDNPNRLWAVDPELSPVVSTTGGVTRNGVRIPGASSLLDALHDIAFAGGTVLLAGSRSQILNSVDGETFFFQTDDAPQADWRAVDLADATRGAVGGTGGTLLLTDAANTIPPPVVVDPPDPPSPSPPRPTPPRPPAPPSPPAVPPLPQPQLSIPRNDVVAKRRGRRVVVTVRGRLALPRGVGAARACTGAVNVTVRKGRRALASRRATLTRRCGFTARVVLQRRRVGRAQRLAVRVRFGGNAFLAPVEKTVGVRVRR